MRVPYSWLKELLPDLPPAEELAEVLTMGGLEVEEIQSWRSQDGAAEDVVLLTKVTANRGDLLSMVGVARHAAALLGLQWQPPQYALPETQEPVTGAPAATVKDLTVEIQAPEACPRYSALLIEGVQVMPSPDWLRQRLEAAGIRPISNVVDCTNYVVWELGQPLHAFDCALVTDTHVIVRMARRGEIIETIDGQERVLSEEDLVIADPERAIALAGVMGGANTEVKDGTTRVLLESAHFDPTTIRKTSLRVGLSTEASYRFERHVDPNLTLPALARAGELIMQTAWGEPEAPALDVKMREFEPQAVEMRAARCNGLLGLELTAEQMAEYLQRLGMEVEIAQDGGGEAGQDEGSKTLRVMVPTFRPDVEREVDLIEEVAIVHGYDQVPETIAGNLTSTGRLTRRQRLERRVAEVLRQCGLNQNLSFSMMDPEDLGRLGLGPDAPERRLVRLANPMSSDASVLRTTLLPALLRACAYNQNQGVTDVALFEVSRVFLATAEGELPEEPLRAAGVLMGNPYTAEWNLPETGLDFFWVKGIVEQLAEALRLEFTFEPSDHPAFQPGQAASVLLDGELVGQVGRLAPQVLDAFDLRDVAYGFELDLEPLFARASLHGRYEGLSRFPAARRDVAVVAPADDEHSAAALEAVIRRAGGEYLEDVRVFDVFADPERFGAGNRSLAFHLTWRAQDRTLTDDEVDRLMEAVVAALKEAGASLRA
ncbi:MAG: phenylalanine--tRNA ligase subunit beta [Armatimonadetes bacterium]|nr:phenylalanine--tRNA ligase subunit beta [Armatimonadota bacterium]